MRDNRINIRLTAGEKRELAKRAAEQNISITDYILISLGIRTMS